jgi:hypothetical protein
MVDMGHDGDVAQVIADGGHDEGPLGKRVGTTFPS